MLLGAVIAAYAPSLQMRVARWPDAPGARLQLALAVLRELQRAARDARPQAARPRRARRRWRTDPLQIEPMLETLVELDWVGRLDEPGGRALRAAVRSGRTPAEPLLARLLMEPSAASRGLWQRAGFRLAAVRSKSWASASRSHGPVSQRLRHRRSPDQSNSPSPAPLEKASLTRPAAPPRPRLQRKACPDDRRQRREAKLGRRTASRCCAAAGKDTVSIIDIGTDPLAPKIVANLPLTNTIIGPPVNLAITPDEGLALVANSMNIVEEGGVLKQVPDNSLWVIDLTANPPKLIDTVAVGKQPSGMSINRAGNLALIANRADNSISVLRITGKKVELIDTVRDRRAGRACRDSRLTESARWRPSSPATRSRCSMWTARR